MYPFSPEDLDEIRSYNDEEFRQAMIRIVNNPLMPQIAQRYFPNVSWEALKDRAVNCATIREFQETFIAGLLHTMVQQTSSGLTSGGADNNPRDRRYVFVSNHRDIITDPALFIISVYFLGYGSTKICLGDNLLTHPFIVDLVKVNKGITVKRNLSSRELLRWSYALSELIIRDITTGIDSVWIAQREGRAKDGNDETQVGVLKMLALGGSGDFVERLEALHIVPVSISYEYDPSDIEKARELHLSKTHGSYSKGPNEDVETMIRGMLGFKGHIHVAVGKEIRQTIQQAKQIEGKKEQAQVIAEAIDEQIQTNYHLWPSNYIAYDILHGSNSMRTYYSLEKKAEFTKRIESQLARYPIDALEVEGIRKELLSMYAQPVTNARRWKNRFH